VRYPIVLPFRSPGPLPAIDRLAPAAGERPASLAEAADERAICSVRSIEPPSAGISFAT